MSPAAIVISFGMVGIILFLLCAIKLTQCKPLPTRTS